MTTYWQSTRYPNKLRVCNNEREEMDAYGLDYDRITRSKYRELKRKQRAAYDEMNNSDSDGRPFKSAGR